MKKLSKGRNGSLIKDFTTWLSLIKYSGRLDTRVRFHRTTVLLWWVIHGNQQTRFFDATGTLERYIPASWSLSIRDWKIVITDTGYQIPTV
jgi:hypothetical protein